MFMRDIGLPPKHWMTLERMVVARRKLEGGRTPQEVAKDLGFLSLLTFRRQFHKCYEMYPEKFVKSRKIFDPGKMALHEQEND
jgi:methylphosphotriester-DNA--protein-cysteine methyltransferase